MNIVDGGGGLGGMTIYPGVKCPTLPQPLCMLSLLCNDQRDREEPGHLKFPIALQEDAGNNVSYLIPMNLVRRGGGGAIYPGVKCPFSLNRHVSLIFM